MDLGLINSFIPPLRTQILSRVWAGCEKGQETVTQTNGSQRVILKPPVSIGIFLKKNKFLGSIQDFLTHKLWRYDPVIYVLTNSPSDSDACESLRTEAKRKRTYFTEGKDECYHRLIAKIPSHFSQYLQPAPQCSCQENPRDSGAWWAAIYRVAQSDTTEAT